MKACLGLVYLPILPHRHLGLVFALWFAPTPSLWKTIVVTLKHIPYSVCTRTCINFITGRNCCINNNSVMANAFFDFGQFRILQSYWHSQYTRPASYCIAKEVCWFHIWFCGLSAKILASEYLQCQYILQIHKKYNIAQPWKYCHQILGGYMVS